MREDYFVTSSFHRPDKDHLGYSHSILDLSVGTYLSASWPSVEATDTFRLLVYTYIQSLTYWALTQSLKLVG